jgi:hypothetical protein
MPYKDPAKQKACASKWYRNNKTRAKAASSRHYEANKEKMKGRIAKWKADNPDKVDLAAHKHGLKKIGWTTELYEAVEIAQGRVCAVCKKKTNKRLSGDHNHTTGKPRGLLCNNCNTGLGMFEDNPHLLEEAAAYLRKYGDS